MSPRFVIVMVALAGFLAGCRHPGASELPSRMRAQNVFLMSERLPSTVRRVAVLPISWDLARPQAESGTRQLQPVLGAELRQTSRFEVVEVSPAQMARWTGRYAWRPEEALPAEFLETLRLAADCDGVLFTHLQAFNPYKPLLIGWSLKLVEANTGFVLWAADEVFDAADKEVARSAVQYGRGRAAARGELAGEDAVLLSPQRFAHFTLSAVFDTLPAR